MESWHKQENETKKAYEWFVKYLEMGADRSIEKLRKASGKTQGYSRHLYEWSRKYNWVARSDAYDLHIIEKAREKYDKELISEKAKALKTYHESMLHIAKWLENIKKTPLPGTKKEDNTVFHFDARSFDIITSKLGKYLGLDKENENNKEQVKEFNLNFNFDDSDGE